MKDSDSLSHKTLKEIRYEVWEKTKRTAKKLILGLAGKKTKLLPYVSKKIRQKLDKKNDYKDNKSKLGEKIELLEVGNTIIKIKTLNKEAKRCEEEWVTQLDILKLLKRGRSNILKILMAENFPNYWTISPKIQQINPQRSQYIYRTPRNLKYVKDKDRSSRKEQ